MSELDLSKDQMTQEYISSNLRLDGFSWCYFKTAKGREGLFLVPVLHPASSTLVKVFLDDGTGSDCCHSFDVPPNEWHTFFNMNLLQQLNDI